MSKNPLIFMQIPHLILNYLQFSYFRYIIRWQIAHGMKLNPFPVQNFSLPYLLQISRCIIDSYNNESNLL